MHLWGLWCQKQVSRTTLRWRQNGRDSVSNHQPHDCLLNRLFRRRSKKTSKLLVTGLCARNSPGTGEFPAQMASYAENVSIWWRHHGLSNYTPQYCVECNYLVMPYIPATGTNVLLCLCIQSPLTIMKRRAHDISYGIYNKSICVIIGPTVWFHKNIHIDKLKLMICRMITSGHGSPSHITGLPWSFLRIISRSLILMNQLDVHVVIYF